MADNFKSMSIEELKAFRLDAADQMAAAKKLFVSAGLVLEEKLSQTPEAKALAKLHEAREELAVIKAAKEEEGGN